MKKIVVVGLGNISHRHRKNIRILDPNAWIIAVPSRKRIVNEDVENANETIEDLDSLNLDGVTDAVIASPANYHMKHSTFFLKENINVLIEKPLAASLDDALSIKRFLSKSKSKSYVAYCLRFNRALNYFKELLNDQYNGNLYSCEIHCGQNLQDWRPKINFEDSVSANKELGGGVINELSHEIDYAQYLFGRIDIKSAEISKKKFIGLDVEDTANIEAFDNKGMEIKMHLNFTQNNPERYCKVVGEKGIIKLDLINNEVIHLKNKNNSKVLFSSTESNDMYLDMFEVFLGMPNKHFNEHHFCTILNSIKVLENIVKIKKYS